MKQIITNNFFPLIVIILLTIIVLQRCENKIVEIAKNKSDTTITNNYYHKDSTVITLPTLVKTEEAKKDTTTVLTVEYVPSKSYDSLVQQFVKLREELLSKNYYSQLVKVDSIGTAIIEDTVKQNKIIGRSIKYDLKIPVKTVTVTNTIYPKLRNKWFIGGEIAGNKQSLINDISAGIQMLNKKDNLYSAKARVDFKGNVYYELGTYWKIKL